MCEFGEVEREVGMHIHASQTSALGNAMAGAPAEETAMSLRRARELRDAATRLKAIAMDVSPDFTAHPQGVAPTDQSILQPIGAHPSAQGELQSVSQAYPQNDPQTVQMIAAWSGSMAWVPPAISPASSIQSEASAIPAGMAQDQQIQQVQPTPSVQPVSYWA